MLTFLNSSLAPTRWPGKKLLEADCRSVLPLTISAFYKIMKPWEGYQRHLGSVTARALALRKRIQSSGKNSHYIVK